MSEMNKPLKFVLECDLYKSGFGFWFGEWEHDSFLKWASRKKLETRIGVRFDAPDRQAICYNMSHGPIVWMPKIPRLASDYSLLNHELVHAAFYAGREAGFVPSEDSEEFYCYLVQWLSREAYKRLWPLAGKRKVDKE